MDEIARCPNPECRNPCKLAHTSGKHPWYFVRCALPETGKLHCCDYRGPQAMDKEEAIRLHNIVCTHPHGPGLCVDCDDSGPIYSDAKIKHMVDRFLGWRLPENFSPDAGISFKRTFNEHTQWPMKNEPIGTNLFDASQATEMVRYMVEGMPEAIAAVPVAEIEELETQLRYGHKAGTMDLIGHGIRQGEVACADRLRALIERHRGNK